MAATVSPSSSSSSRLGTLDPAASLVDNVDNQLDTRNDDDEDDERDYPAITVKPRGLVAQGIAQIRKWLGLPPKMKPRRRRKKPRRKVDAHHASEKAAELLTDQNDDEDDELIPGAPIASPSSQQGKGQAAEYDSDDENADPIKRNAATKCQSVVRRFLAKFARHRQWKLAVKSAEYFALKAHEYAQDKVLRSRQGQAMQELFVKTYVGDVMSTAKLWMIQCAVVVQIQALYRGYKVRKIYNLKRLLRKPKPKPTRVTSEMARRVWARAEFEPKGGWPGIRTSVLQYDLMEHADRPPSNSGREDFGTKVYKVAASARSRREEQVLLSDKSAWVGLPVHLEPQELYARRKKEKKPASMLLDGTTPYLEHRQIRPKSPPKLAGIDLLRSLGWREDMVDKQAEVVPPVQRAGYQIINPLDVHTTAYINDSMTLPSALHKRLHNKPPSPTSHSHSDSEHKQRPELGSLQQAPIEKAFGVNRSIIPGQGGVSPGRSVWTSPNVNENSLIYPDLLPGEQPSGPSGGSSAVGGGSSVGKGSVVGGGSVASTANAMNSTFLEAPAGVGGVTRLITPLRGPIKPIPSSHRAALKQHYLLPEQVNRASKRTKANGYEDERWRQSTWGTLKLKAAELAAAEAAFNDLAGDDGDDDSQTVGTLDSGGSLSILPSKSQRLKALKALKDDPWSRQLYRPKVKVPCRLEAFPLKPKKHFKVRYSWLPQPLVSEAANKVYKDGRDVDNRSYQRPIPLLKMQQEGGAGAFMTSSGLDSPSQSTTNDIFSQPSFVTHWTSLDGDKDGDGGKQEGGKSEKSGKSGKSERSEKKDNIVKHPYVFL